MSVNVPEWALAGFESGPLDPTFLLEVSRSELPVHLEVSSCTAPARGLRSPSRCQSRGGTRAGGGGSAPLWPTSLLLSTPAPALWTHPGDTGGAGARRGCGAGLEALGLGVGCG